MNTIRPIRDEASYDAALARIDNLMDSPHGSAARDEMDVLVTLVEAYEDEHYPIDLPSPIDAIQFRMDQAGLKPADLVPYIGSRGKVSEVLSGKLPLTLKMIRALNRHLGIPAEILIGEGSAANFDNEMDTILWDRFPVTEMMKRDWLPAMDRAKDFAQELMTGLIARAGGREAVPQALYRKNDAARQNARMDAYALQAWCMHVLATARERAPRSTYNEGAVDEAYMRYLATLSRLPDGPKRAVEALEKVGIIVVYAKHLPKTHLDGAAMRTIEGVPVIGLTLRYDRLDNFWFCLLHEVAHVWRHLSDDCSFYVDDLSLEPSDHAEDWALENEADTLARNALIPADAWAEAALVQRATPSSVIAFAQSVNVHPAIVAGRVRRDTGNFRLLSQFVGSNEVRRHFEEAP
jgi:HTH-type transcriptional regulator/antitoxin HigA